MITMDITLVIQIVNMIALMFLLNAVLYKPIKKILKERSEKLHGMEEDISDFEKKAALRQSEVDAKMAKASGKAKAALDNARAAGAVESVYVDGKGQVLEGTTSNLFAVLKGRLITPSIDILPGVTRDVVLDLTAAEFRPELKMIQKEELLL